MDVFGLHLGEPEASGSFFENLEFQAEIHGQGKSVFHLPRQVIYTINRTLVNWGKVGQDVPQTRINTTVSTTKA